MLRMAFKGVNYYTPEQKFATDAGKLGFSNHTILMLMKVENAVVGSVFILLLRARPGEEDLVNTPDFTCEDGYADEKPG